MQLNLSGNSRGREMVTGSFLWKPLIQLRCGKHLSTWVSGPFKLQSEDDAALDFFLGPRPFKTALGNWKLFPRILAAQPRVQPGNGNLPGKLSVSNTARCTLVNPQRIVGSACVDVQRGTEEECKI